MADEEIIRKAIRELSAVLAATEETGEIESFLFSLLTKAEIREIATRWALVREIDGGMTQREISKKYSLSLCKITRGSRELKKPDSPFKSMIGRLPGLGIPPVKKNNES
jgi:TrpR family trp operon transcriptional repressor